jgi:hypothetical protein
MEGHIHQEVKRAVRSGMLRVEFGVSDNLSMVEVPTRLRLLQSRQPYHAKFKHPQDMRQASREDSAPSVMAFDERRGARSLPKILVVLKDTGGGGIDGRAHHTGGVHYFSLKWCKRSEQCTILKHFSCAIANGR